MDSSSESSEASSHASPTSRDGSYLVHFDIDGFQERLAEFCKTTCCRAECTKRSISVRGIERQSALLDSLHVGSPSTQRHHLRAHMQHTYLLTWARDNNDRPRKQHDSTYRTSTIKTKLCRAAWLALHDTTERTWQRWVQSMDPLDPTPRMHGSVGREGDNSPAYKAEERAAVK